MLRAIFKIFYNLFPILALIFGALYLISFDIGNIEINIGLFLFSLIFLLGLFFFRVYIWFIYLKKIESTIDFRICIVSRFKFILTKYLPGKFWLHLGAGAVQKKYTNQNFVSGTFNAIAFQLINNVAGFVIGGTGLLLLISKENRLLLFTTLILLLISSLFFFSKQRKIAPFKLFLFLGKRFRSIDFNIPECKCVFILLIIQWIFLGTSYFLLIQSAGFDISANVILLQPLANNFGMIAIFSPGGIGIREGIMVLYLNQMGLTLENASMIAVLSRFWFLLVEFFSFFVGFIIEKQIQKDLLGPKEKLLH